VADSRSETAAESKDPVPPCATCNSGRNSDSNFLSGVLDLKPILDAIDNFEAAGKRLDESASRALASGTIDSKLADTINRGAMQVERNWLNPDGIPGRPWFKHILYGARFTYAHLELPGLTEAVEKQDWATAKQQAEILRQALVNNTKLVNELNATLNGRTTEQTARHSRSDGIH
ncbi:MAG: transferrin receptor-like dimerization domain-containing protein, partial [Candidatus Sulfotelmatobacter sp.]